MKNMTLKEIAVACGGIYYGDDESYYKEVSSVVIDSRKVEKDCLFIAIRGARVDGHMFIPQTIRDGALCALSEKRIENASYPYILVTSCEQALKDIAEHYRLHSVFGRFDNLHHSRISIIFLGFHDFCFHHITDDRILDKQRIAVNFSDSFPVHSDIFNRHLYYIILLHLFFSFI